MEKIALLIGYSVKAVYRVVVSRWITTLKYICVDTHRLGSYSIRILTTLTEHPHPFFNEKKNNSTIPPSPTPLENEVWPYVISMLHWITWKLGLEDSTGIKQNQINLQPSRFALFTQTNRRLAITTIYGHCYTLQDILEPISVRKSCSHGYM